VAGSTDLIDTVRSYAPGFIFTTSLPPSVAAGAQASIAYQKSYLGDRRLQQLNTIALKDQLAKKDIPVIPNPSHIVPVLVGDAAKAKAASDLLLTDHGIYVQSINFPTVPVGEERLRITPTPGHTAQQTSALIKALESVWDTLELKRASDWAAMGGRAGVGIPNPEPVERIWADDHLGLHDGTAPTQIGATAPISTSTSISIKATAHVAPVLSGPTAVIASA